MYVGSRRFKKHLFIVLAIILSVSLVVPLAVMFVRDPAGVDHGGHDYTVPDINRVMALEAQLEEDPENLEALLELADAYSYLRSIELELDTYERIFELDPDQMRMRYNAAIGYYSIGQIDEALEHVEVVAQDEGGQFALNALWLKASILANGKNDYKAAIRTMEEYIAASDPEHDLEAAKQSIANWQELSNQTR